MTCLEKRKSILGDNHPNVLKSINSLAVLHDEQGQYGKARHLVHVEGLEKRKATLAENHPDTLKSINNLAVL